MRLQELRILNNYQYLTSTRFKKVPEAQNIGENKKQNVPKVPLGTKCPQSVKVELIKSIEDAPGNYFYWNSCSVYSDQHF